MEYSYKFYQNKQCQFFPCHNLNNNIFSCLFCYCPLYCIEDCGGDYFINSKNIKDCSNCALPHLKSNYSYIINRLREEYDG